MVKIPFHRRFNLKARGRFSVLIELNNKKCFSDMA